MTPSDSSTSESQLDGFFRFVAGLAAETCSEAERDFVDGADKWFLEETPLESVCRTR